MQRIAFPLIVLLFVGSSAHADATLVGKPAPPAQITAWATPSAHNTLADLHGQVCVLLLGSAGDLSDEGSVAYWSDVRAAYRKAGLRVIAIHATKPTSVPESVEFSVAVGDTSAYGTDAQAVLIDADGEVAWQGAPREIPYEQLTKLLKKTKRFYLKKLDAIAKPAATEFRRGKLAEARAMASGPLAHADLTYITEQVNARLTFWKGQISRSTNNPADVALYMGLIDKHMSGSPEHEELAARIKAIKSDKAVSKEVKAAVGFAKLHANWVRAKGKRKKIDAVVKKAERFVKQYEETRGAERVARFAASIKADPALTAIRAFIKQQNSKTSGSSWRTRLPKPPIAPFSADRTYYWDLETSEGSITLRFFPSAPMHVTSAIYLTELGFYDGLTFHRIIPNFMAQGGCPTGTGSGHAGYQYDGEFESGRKHDKAVLSAAHSGPGTDGSQFFITFGSAAHLDGKHTVFGEVVDGMPTLKKLEKIGTTGGQPTKTVTINKASIRVE